MILIESELRFLGAKGSRKNKLRGVTRTARDSHSWPCRFAAELVSPRKRNRRRSPSYVEDYAIAACESRSASQRGHAKARPIDVVKMGCQNVKLFLREPQVRSANASSSRLELCFGVSSPVFQLGIHDHALFQKGEC